MCYYCEPKIQPKILFSDNMRANEEYNAHQHGLDNVEYRVNLCGMFKVIWNQKCDLGHLGGIGRTDPETCEKAQKVEGMDFIAEEEGAVDEELEEELDFGYCEATAWAVVDEARDLTTQHRTETIDNHAEGGEPELLGESLVEQDMTIEGHHETLGCGRCTGTVKEQTENRLALFVFEKINENLKAFLRVLLYLDIALGHFWVWQNSEYN